MRCAACGYEVGDAEAAICPNCGQPIRTTVGAGESVGGGGGSLGGDVPGGTWAPAVAEGAAAPTPAPDPAPIAPVYPGDVASAPIPSATVPSAPMPSAPTVAQAPRLTAGLSPLPPTRKQRSLLPRLLIGALVAVAAVVGLYALVNAQENDIIKGKSVATATDSAPHTPVTVTSYQNSFSVEATGWASDEHCGLRSDGYHVTTADCLAPAGDFGGADIQVTVEQLSGRTFESYGVTLRGVEADNRYDVLIDSDSQWRASRCDGLTGSNTLTCYSLVPFTTNAAIHGGLDAKNTIKVSARGSHFDVFINGVQVGSFDDTTYSSGQVGLEAGQNIDCVFTDLTIMRIA